MRAVPTEREWNRVGPPGSTVDSVPFGLDAARRVRGRQGHGDRGDVRSVAGEGARDLSRRNGCDRINEECLRVRRLVVPRDVRGLVIERWRALYRVGYG